MATDQKLAESNHPTLDRRRRFYAFLENLKTLAGVSVSASEDVSRDGRIEAGGETQWEYEATATTLALIRLKKVQRYGTSRYEPESAEYNLAMTYGDLERKLIRLKQMIFMADEYVAEDIAETAGDMANYAIQMVQLVYRLQERNLL